MVRIPYISDNFNDSCAIVTIKYAPLVGTSKINGTIGYFLNNFTHNWGLKLIASSIIAIVINVLMNKIIAIQK